MGGGGWRPSRTRRRWPLRRQLPPLRLLNSTSPTATTPASNPASSTASTPPSPASPPSPRSRRHIPPALEKIDQQIAEAQRLFDPAKPELTAPPLRIALGALDDFLRELENGSINDLPPAETYNLLHELHIKRVQLNNALVLALGLTLHATAKGDTLFTTAPSVDVVATLHNSGQSSVTKHESSFSATPAQINAGDFIHWLGDGKLLKPGDSQDYAANIPFPHGIAATKPYFSRPDSEQSFYDIADPALRNAPATPAPLTATVSVLSQASQNDPGVRLQLSAVVAPANLAAPPAPIAVVPPVSVALDQRARILRSSANTITVRMTKIPPPPNIASQTLGAPHDWSELDPNSTPVRNNGYLLVSFAVPPTHRETVTLHGSVTLQDGHTTPKATAPSATPASPTPTTTPPQPSASSPSTSPPPPTSTSPTSPAPATTSPPHSTNSASTRTSSPPPTSPPNPSSPTTPSSSASAPTSTANSPPPTPP
jgi:hypothetical protein